MASSLKPDIMVTPSDLFIATANVSGTVPYITQTPELGVRAVAGDGREYRYVQAGSTALITGQLLQAPAPQSNLQAITGVAVAQFGTSVTLTISTGTAITAGQLAGSYFMTYGTVANGGGQMLAIQTNSAVSASGTSITITLADPLQIALTTSATVDIWPHSYIGVIQMPTTQTNKAVGVALGVFNNTSSTLNGLPASYYGWMQVKGISMSLIQGTPAANTALSASTTTAGAFEEQTTSTAASNYGLAVNLVTGVNGQYGPVDLLIS